MSSGRTILLIILSTPCIVHALQCKCTYSHSDAGSGPDKKYSYCNQNSCTVNETVCKTYTPSQPLDKLPYKAACTKNFIPDVDEDEAGYTCDCVDKYKQVKKKQNFIRMGLLAMKNHLLSYFCHRVLARLSSQ